jgi:hypothetical protein
MNTTIYQAIGQDYDDNWIVATVALDSEFAKMQHFDVPLYIKRHLNLCLLEDYKVLTQEAAQ